MTAEEFRKEFMKKSPEWRSAFLELAELYMSATKAQRDQIDTMIAKIAAKNEG